MIMNRGLFIVFEGLDRSGKSTQAKMLAEALEADGVKCVVRHYPDRTSATGKIIASYLEANTAALKAQNTMSNEAMHLLFSANRWERDAEFRRLLEAGTTIICDRYSFSGVAYSVAKGLSDDWCKASDEGLLLPDRIIYVDVPVDVCVQRGDFGEERYEVDTFQRRVESVYRDLLRNVPIVEKVDGQLSREHIHKKILKLVESMQGQQPPPPLKKLHW